MRKYIFSESKWRRLDAWLNGGEEDLETRKLFARMRRNLAKLKREVELLSSGIHRLNREGSYVCQIVPLSSGSEFSIIASLVSLFHFFNVFHTLRNEARGIRDEKISLY